jgi:tetratricopeptide (TPR) repeat protein
MEERIEKYFEEQLSVEEKNRFEADLNSDPELASAVAFYLAAKNAAAQEVRSRNFEARHAEWQSLRKSEKRSLSWKTWYAVAAVLALVTFGLIWNAKNSATNDLEVLASGYAMEHFTTLPVQMGDTRDSIQLAADSYNKGQYATSAKICEQILERDSLNAEAKKIAGIVSLKLLDYDKAIKYFQQLGNQKNLYSNPGKFYEAIALLKSGSPSDQKRAEVLLKAVIDGNLEGKNEAMKWLE